MGRPRAATAAVAAMWIVLAGCGGESADSGRASTTTLDRGTWSEGLEAACADLNEQYRDLATADPADRQEALAHAAEVADYAADLRRALDRAGTPVEGGDTDQLADLVDQLADAAQQLSSSAEQGDADATAAAADRVAEAGERINPVAESLDVPSCGGF